MAQDFVGRDRELEKLDKLLGRTAETGQGAFLSMRGRRQVGKSRLVEECIRRSRARAVFHTASRQDADAELEAFRQAVAASSTAAAAIAAERSLGSWEAALTLLAGEATAGDPVVVVLDEFPYLVDSVPGIEGIVQKVWDRTLERRAILLIVVGSDISVMEMLGTYGRPLFGRVEEMVVPPLSPKEIADMLSLGAVEAVEAYLVIGGFPRLAGRWQRDDDLWSFLERELSDPESSLIVLGERVLHAEFPADLKGRDILRAIGSGERAFQGIRTRAGVSQGTLETSLRTLAETKRVIVKELPYSTEPRPKLSRYAVSDPYLRFWLRFVDGEIPTVQRGRGDVVLARIRHSWREFQGLAIEPVVRRGIELLLPDPRFGESRFVGGFWNRDNSIQVDLVGGREEHVTDTVDFIGSVTWRETRPFGRADLAALTDSRRLVPGATAETLLVGVSRTGFESTGLDVALSAADVLSAYA